MTDSYTSEDFEATLALIEAAEAGQAHPSTILAALRIAANVMRPGWIEEISPISSGEERWMAEAIRKAAPLVHDDCLPAAAPGLSIGGVPTSDIIAMLEPEERAGAVTGTYRDGEYIAYRIRRPGSGWLSRLLGLSAYWNLQVNRRGGCMATSANTKRGAIRIARRWIDDHSPPLNPDSIP